jgi:hypothetical protein
MPVITKVFSFLSLRLTRSGLLTTPQQLKAAKPRLIIPLCFKPCIGVPGHVTAVHQQPELHCIIFPYWHFLSGIQGQLFRTPTWLPQTFAGMLKEIQIQLSHALPFPYWSSNTSHTSSRSLSHDHHHKPHCFATASVERFCPVRIMLQFEGLQNSPNRATKVCQLDIFPKA